MSFRSVTCTGTVPVQVIDWKDLSPYWQPNKNNQPTEHTDNIKITQPKKSP